MNGYSRTTENLIRPGIGKAIENNVRVTLR